MSSRVFRPGNLPGATPLDAQPMEAAPLDAQPMVWRRAGGTAPPHDRQGRDPAHSAAPSAAEQSAEMERQIQARAATAREQGRAEAESGAQQRALDRVTPVLAALQSLIGDLSGQGHRLRIEAERDTVKLAMAIARRILHREITVDPEAVLGLVKAAFAKVEARETHRLRVAPADAALLREQREKLELPPAIEILADASLAPGSAIFETSRGDLDASVDTQLAEIERGLADIVRRRLK